MGDKKYSSFPDTVAHQAMVNVFVQRVIRELNIRGRNHDYSKTKSPELEVFDEVTPKLHGLTYDSAEYKESLASMGEALKHHYQENRHHPEHFVDGVRGMNLIDVVEMFCDWLAATKRHADGNIYESINKNNDRFKTGPVLQDIFINTAHWFEDQERGT